MPNDGSVRQAIERFLGQNKASAAWHEVLAVTLRGLSFSDIEREVLSARRSAVTRSTSLEDVLSGVVQSRVEPLAAQGTRADCDVADGGRHFAAAGS